MFSRIFYKIGTKYNLGLSATLTRTDGLTKVIKYFLGETIVSLKLSILNPKIVIKFTNIEPLVEKRMANGKANIPGMINDLCDSFARNLEIVNIIKEKYYEGRKILVLTHRRNNCNDLKRLLESTLINSENVVGLYYGGMKKEALQESNKKKIIVATYQAASEGYDNPELDTLVLATPKSNIEQAIGRILRQKNINYPEVLDFVDAWSVFNNLYFSRMKYYKKKKYNIIGDIKINENENINQNIKLDKCIIIDET
jgi:superfamily II DNA or RNA helicase